MHNITLPTTIEGLGIKLIDLCGTVQEIREDGKKTLAQAQATNGRVNNHDAAIKTLSEDVESLKKSRSNLFDWILRLLIAGFGADTILGRLGDLIKHLTQ